MAKKGVNSEVIKLKSSESSHFYSTFKNKKNVSEKIKLKKYDPILRKRVLYQEVK